MIKYNNLILVLSYSPMFKLQSIIIKIKNNICEFLVNSLEEDVKNNYLIFYLYLEKIIIFAKFCSFKIKLYLLFHHFLSF